MKQTRRLGFLPALLIAALLLAACSLLAGLGASAAILMLIFKDSILGFVSGIMLSANKMLKPGDWISMPQYNVDGPVLEGTPKKVKTDKFDNTIPQHPASVLTLSTFNDWL